MCTSKKYVLDYVPYYVSYYCPGSQVLGRKRCRKGEGYVMYAQERTHFPLLSVVLAHKN